MNSNLNLYKVFYYVALYGTTAAASRELFISQPSVSLSIKRLESQMGCDLFARSTKGMRLTKYGSLLFENVAVAVKAIEKAEAEIAQTMDNGLDTVDIAGIDTTFQFFLLPNLKCFEEKDPNVIINLHQCTGIQDAEAMLDAGTVDFAVMQVPSKLKEYVSIPIKDVMDVLIYDAEYSSHFNSDTLRAENLIDYRIISHIKGAASRDHVDAYLLNNGIRFVPEYEYSHVSSIIRQIKQGFFLAFVLKDIIKDELESGRVRQLELDPPMPHRYYYLIAPSELHSDVADRLRTFLTTEAITMK